MTDTTEIEGQALTVDAPKSRKGGAQITDVMDAVPLLDTSRFEHMQRVANVMASTTLVPDALRFEGPADNKQLLPRAQILSNCFMVVNQAVRWGLDPFAVAQGVSVVHGKLCYEGKLVAAVLQAKLGLSLKHYFTGNRGGDDYRIYLSDQTLSDEMIAELKPGIRFNGPRVFDGSVGEWKTTGKNTPWTTKNYPRMLAYRGTRDWCRIYEPALMLGVYTPDEMLTMEDGARYREARDVTPQTSLAKQIAARQTEQEETPQEPQEGFNADFVKEQTEAIQSEPQGGTEAAASDEDPVAVALEMIASLKALQNSKQIDNTWKLQFEKRVAAMDSDDRSDLTDIAQNFSAFVAGKIEQVALDNFCEDVLAAIAERNSEMMREPA